MTLTCGCEVTLTDPARITKACDRHSPIGLRDHFAGQALAGIASRMNSELVARYMADMHDGREAGVAYKLADAMLAEREKD